MPRFSKRVLFLRHLNGLLNHRLKHRLYRSSADDDDDSIEEAKDAALASIIKHCEGKRYLFRSATYRKGRADRFSDDLPPLPPLETVEEATAALPWLTAEEFLQKYRMSRDAFNWVLGQIEDNEEFTTVGNEKKGRPQAPVVHQLMVFLKYVGTEGAGSNSRNQRQMFGIGQGTADLFRDRVMRAILKLRPTYYNWPDKEERKKLAKKVLKKTGFPNVVGIADGTLFPLAFEPETEDAPDYKGRKHTYTLTVMIICDYDRKIRYYHSGYPGSAHDNRVYRNMDLCQNPKNYFSENEFNLGDSAFSNSPYMVSSFKKPFGEEIPEEHERFNKLLSKVRMRSEHTIGILKGRFPWLRSIRMKITTKKRSLRRILRLLDATIILHNMLLTFKENMDVTDWIDKDKDDISDYDAEGREEDMSELTKSIPEWMPNDARRSQLLYYFQNFVWHT